MKKILILLCAMLLSMGAFGVASASVITFNPLNDTQTSGSPPFSLTIVGSGFTEGAGGSIGGGMDVSWDPTILSLNSATGIFPGDMGFGSNGIIDNVAGTLTGLSVTSFFGTASAAFNIASLSFNAIGVGLTNTGITISLIDVWTDQLGGAITQPNAIGGTVTVNGGGVIPIPGTALLFGSGLLGIVAIGRKKRS